MYTSSVRGVCRNAASTYLVDLKVVGHSVGEEEVEVLILMTGAKVSW